jgi:hypothetical protein
VGEQRLAADGKLLGPPLEEPGHHRLVHAESDALVRRFCVRIDPAESSLTPLDLAEVSAAVPGWMHLRVHGQQPGQGRATVLRPTSLIPLFAVLMLLCLLGEGVLGRRR